MKVATQTGAEHKHFATLIQDMAVAMLSGHDASGHLVSRPMSPLELDAHGSLWFFTDLRSEKTEHLRLLNLAFTDHARATYVSVSGRGEIHTTRAHIRSLWTPFMRPWFPDGPDSTNLALLKFVPETAEYWDAPSSTMVRTFAKAASMVAARPIGLGEHDTLTHLASGAAAGARP